MPLLVCNLVAKRRVLDHFNQLLPLVRLVEILRRGPPEGASKSMITTPVLRLLAISPTELAEQLGEQVLIVGELLVATG